MDDLIAALNQLTSAVVAATLAMRALIAELSKNEEETWSGTTMTPHIA